MNNVITRIGYKLRRLSWVRTVTNGRFIPKNIVEVIIRNQTLGSRARKLDQWEFLLVLRTDHPSVPGPKISDDIKLAWDPLTSFRN